MNSRFGSTSTAKETGKRQTHRPEACAVEPGIRLRADANPVGQHEPIAGEAPRAAEQVVALIPWRAKKIGGAKAQSATRRRRRIRTRKANTVKCRANAPRTVLAMRVRCRRQRDRRGLIATRARRTRRDDQKTRAQDRGVEREEMQQHGSGRLRGGARGGAIRRNRRLRAQSDRRKPSKGYRLSTWITGRPPTSASRAPGRRDARRASHCDVCAIASVQRTDDSSGVSAQAQLAPPPPPCAMIACEGRDREVLEDMRRKITTTFRRLRKQVRSGCFLGSRPAVVRRR